MSMQSLEEKEHEIRIMTENASRFVRLIVKECDLLLMSLLMILIDMWRY